MAGVSPAVGSANGTVTPYIGGRYGSRIVAPARPDIGDDGSHVGIAERLTKGWHAIGLRISSRARRKSAVEDGLDGVDRIGRHDGHVVRQARIGGVAALAG